MSRHIAALSITLTSIILLVIGSDSLALPSETKGSYTVENQDNTPTVRGEMSETITQEGASDSGGSPSQEHPSVRASDPSMWEEQSHRECSPEKDEYGLDKFKCNLATLNRPGQPDQPTTSGSPRTVTVTTRQAATLIASGSGITRQPPGPKVIISMAFIVYTNPAPRYQTTTILGTSIEVEFTPTSYTWGWGDGTTTTTTDPGAPYPNQTVTHHYQHTATGVTTTLTTTWTTRYRPQGDPTWRPIEGTITTTETSTPYDLVRVVTYLTDDAEEAQGH